MVDEQEYFNEDLEGLFTRIERLLLQSSLAYGDVCYLLDQVLNEYDKENNIENVEKFVKNIIGIWMVGNTTSGMRKKK